MKRWEGLRRVDMQVSILTAAIVIVSCLGVYGVTYSLSYRDMIGALQERVVSIYNFVTPYLRPEMFQNIRTRSDETTADYVHAKELLESVKSGSGVRYLYTATRTESGAYIYLVDGLPDDSLDFRHAGDPIEPEIIPDLDAAIQGQWVMPDEIKPTSWGYIFIAYLPVRIDGMVAGAIGIEFDAAHQYRTFRLLRLATPLVIAISCLIAGVVAMVLFRRLSNPTFQDLATTDFLTGLRSRNAFELDASNHYEAPRALSGVALLVVDLDGLKQVNDTLGHQAGDAYIRACGQAMRAAVGRAGVVYRMGGDEFAAILKTESDEDVRDTLTALERQVAQDNETAVCKVSYSVGYAVYDAQRDKTLYSLLDRADAMMYENKREKKQTNVSRR